MDLELDLVLFWTEASARLAQGQNMSPKCLV